MTATFDDVYDQWASWLSDQGVTDPDEATTAQWESLVSLLKAAGMTSYGEPRISGYATDMTEDGEVKSRSWDFWYDDDTPIDKLADLAQALGRDPKSVAHDVLTLPFGLAAPARLRMEATVELIR